jgi:hypothetical protein
VAEYRAPTGQRRRYVLPHQHHPRIDRRTAVRRSIHDLTISDLEEIIAEALDKFVSELPEEIEGRVAIVDGSLCPCWSWADAAQLYSGKHKTTGHAHQFVCDLFGRLMHISDPLPGSTHDAKATHETELSELLRDDNAIGDKGYIGTGITTPYRKPAGGELLDWQKEFNTAVNKIRYVIERAMSHFKPPGEMVQGDDDRNFTGGSRLETPVQRTASQHLLVGGVQTGG